MLDVIESQPFNSPDQLPMSENLDVYRAPQADLNVYQSAEDGSGNFRFYVVSVRKFLILFLATFSMYSIFWLYKNFKLNKDFLKNDDWPIPRAIFSIFFVHRLFADIDEHLLNKGRNYQWQHSLLATFYVLMLIVGRVLDRMSPKSSDFTWFDGVGLLLLLAEGGVLVFVQRAINAACLSEGDDPNNHLTTANWVWIGLGLLAWILIFYVGWTEGSAS